MMMVKLHLDKIYEVIPKLKMCLRASELANENILILALGAVNPDTFTSFINFINDFSLIVWAHSIYYFMEIANEESWTKISNIFFFIFFRI